MFQTLRNQISRWLHPDSKGEFPREEEYLSELEVDGDLGPDFSGLSSMPEEDESLPDLDPEEFKEMDIRVRKKVRLLLKEGHRYEPTKLMRRQEVTHALQGIKIPDSFLREMVLPWATCRGFIWEEYAGKRLWSLDEAASLSVGMDPLMFEQEPGQYYPGWREEREEILIKTREAILLGELPAISEGDKYHVMPLSFCSWADGKELLTSNLAKPLKDLVEDQVYIDHPSTLEVVEAEFIALSQQLLLLSGLSETQRRLHALFAFAFYIKLEDPKQTREKIAKRIFNSLSKDCQNLKGFTISTIRKNLHDIDQDLNHSTRENCKFFNTTICDQELGSTDPTHPWWNPWRQAFSKKYPLSALPSDFSRCTAPPCKTTLTH
jgi:hypothetical protein